VYFRGDDVGCSTKPVELLENFFLPSPRLAFTKHKTEEPPKTFRYWLKKVSATSVKKEIHGRGSTPMECPILRKLVSNIREGKEKCPIVFTKVITTLSTTPLTFFSRVLMT
jgi:hypothetical protein